MVLLYDLERYGGESWAPRYKRGIVRFSLVAWSKHPGSLFSSPIWSVTAASLTAARAMVPTGGRYFDRTGNWPSPMVPLEGWWFDCEPAMPMIKAETMGQT